jgi:hypothetical protein
MQINLNCKQKCGINYILKGNFYDKKTDLLIQACFPASLKNITVKIQFRVAAIMSRKLGCLKLNHEQAQPY